MRKKTYQLLASLLLMLIASLTSCEKFAFENADTTTHDADGNVTIRVKQVQNMKIGSASRAASKNGLNISRSTSDDYLGFSRASSEKDLKDICTRISFVVFDVEEKLQTIHQTQDTHGFGTAHFNLDEGEYRLVVIAHNGTGNCTISSPEKVKFSSNKLTDTFYYYGRLSVTEDGAQADIHLTRPVAAFRLHITDETLPEEAKSIKFYYTGGSSTLDATTGYGCVNSRQTESFSLISDQKDFTVYTFPHDPEEGKTVKMDISLLDPDAKTIKEFELPDVTMKRNTITKASISIKDGSIKGEGEEEQEKEGGLGFTVDDEWLPDTIVYF